MFTYFYKISLVFMLSVLMSPANAAFARWLGWGYSDSKIYQDVVPWVKDGVKTLLPIGVPGPVGAIAGAAIPVIIDLIDPPSGDAILSGRLSMTFNPSQQVLSAGWLGDFASDPSLLAPPINASSIDPSIIQITANAGMSFSSITLNQGAGSIVFNFNWGPSGYYPASTGHFNTMAIVFAANGTDTGATAMGSPGDVAVLGTDSPTYMLCSSGYCGSNPVPEPEMFYLFAAGLGMGGLLRKRFAAKAI